MILAALLSISLLQVAQPPAAQTKETNHQQKWWQQLSEEERAQMRKRMESMREMSPEARKELEGRRKVFEEEKALLIKQLSEEDRARYEALDVREQAHFVREQVHERLRQRGERLRQRFPGMEKGKLAFEESRRKQVMEGIVRAGEDGWFGPHALEYFKQAPLHEAMHALMEVQKWQFLEQAQETEFWAKKKVGEERQRRISALPAPEFFREIQSLVDGRPKGPPRGHREGREDQGGRAGQGPPHGGRRPGGPEPGPPQPPKEGGRYR
ncbi:MAG: hypothetical protein QM477_04350 [Planctomycetota bacterium]